MIYVVIVVGPGDKWMQTKQSDQDRNKDTRYARGRVEHLSGDERWAQPIAGGQGLRDNLCRRGTEKTRTGRVVHARLWYVRRCGREQPPLVKNKK
jgi:hypothetical protein